MADTKFEVKGDELAKATDHFYAYTDYLNEVLTAIEKGNISEVDKHFGLTMLALPLVLLEGLRRRMLNIMKQEIVNNAKGTENEKRSEILGIQIDPSQHKS